METKGSKINRKMAEVIKMERSVGSKSVVELAGETGISVAVLNRMFSKNPRDLNITQIAYLAGMYGTTPQELVAMAVSRAGGMEKILAEMRSRVSEVGPTMSELEKKRQEKQAEAQSMSTDQLENEIPNAATIDPELDTDEPS